MSTPAGLLSKLPVTVGVESCIAGVTVSLFPEVSIVTSTFTVTVTFAPTFVCVI